ncbi:hypothetical protein TEQG_08623 [Trichophyton equinum CBS 127.97]|uniref:Uncharacterized protein n=1 Tax=Trichophyton equinum (strain ATCC MYA-4606 / CBS 127.97) TaxID=559882 RepID=F2PMY3_TRIEC|nr:hypothetical protein TEQG_08623 [Trichophyton equinum CBS 127.97]
MCRVFREALGEYTAIAAKLAAAVSRMAIFSLRGVGWSVAPAMITELKGLYNKIMEPIREIRSEAA